MSVEYFSILGGKESIADCCTKKFDAAQAAYRRVLDRDPNHAKVLQQLGWLYHQQSSSYASQEKAIEYLEKSVSAGMLNEFGHKNCWCPR